MILFSSAHADSTHHNEVRIEGRTPEGALITVRLTHRAAVTLLADLTELLKDKPEHHEIEDHH